MNELCEVFTWLDSKIQSSETAYLEINIDVEHNRNIWTIKDSPGSKKSQMNNPKNLCIFQEIYKYLLDKYGESEVYLLIPCGAITEHNCPEVYIKNIYIRYTTGPFASELDIWVSQKRNEIK